MHEEMVSRLKWRSYGSLKDSFKRVVSSGKLTGERYCKNWIFLTINMVMVVGSVAFIFVVIGSGYIYIFPRFQPSTLGTMDRNQSEKLGNKCNVFDGRWVRDESYPLYNASECPFVEIGFNCLANGRRDKGYLKWRWKPKDCDIPRFNVNKILEMLRGKRVVFVGDSLSRTQWESMICMLMTGVENKKSVYEINGKKITKQIRHLGVRFRPFNFTVEFYRSVFLVQPGPAPKRAPKRVNTVLKLDKLDDISKEWIDSDILIFNSGHWWTPTKLFEIQGLVLSDWRKDEAQNVNN